MKINRIQFCQDFFWVNIRSERSLKSFQVRILFWQPINLAMFSMSFWLPFWSLLNHCENDISELCVKVFRATILKERLEKRIRVGVAIRCCRVYSQGKFTYQFPSYHLSLVSSVQGLNTSRTTCHRDQKRDKKWCKTISLDSSNTDGDFILTILSALVPSLKPLTIIMMGLQLFISSQYPDVFCSITSACWDLRQAFVFVLEGSCHEQNAQSKVFTYQQKYKCELKHQFCTVTDLTQNRNVLCLFAAYLVSLLVSGLEGLFFWTFLALY